MRSSVKIGNQTDQSSAYCSSMSLCRVVLIGRSGSSFANRRSNLTYIIDPIIHAESTVQREKLILS